MRAFLSVLAVCMRVATVAAQYAVADGLCSEQAGDATCSGAACQRKFDVVTGLTGAECQMVCDVLDRTCTGYEMQNSFNDRCELWKVPIGAVNVADKWFEECYNKTTVGDSDGDLYFYFKLEVYRMNGTAVLEKTNSEQKQLAELIKSTVASVYTAANVPLSASDIKINISNASAQYVTTIPQFATTATTMQVGIINRQPDKTLPIRMYRLLVVSDDDAQDGLTRTHFIQAMTANATSSAFAAAGVLEVNRTSVYPSVRSGFFSTEPPVDVFSEDTTTTVMEDTTTWEDTTTPALTPNPNPNPGTGNSMSTTTTEDEDEQTLNATNTTVTAMDGTTTPNQQTGNNGGATGTMTMTMTETLLIVSGAHPTRAALAANFKLLVSLAGVWAWA